MMLMTDSFTLSLFAYPQKRHRKISQTPSPTRYKYFCVTCDERHPVFLKVAKEFSDYGHFNVPAWVSHYSDNIASSEDNKINKRHKPSPESALHHNAKHILCSKVGQYEFETERCLSCDMCSRIENGSEAQGGVEHFEKLSDGKSYKFDAVVLRKGIVSSVLEVWASHETSNEKREYCFRKGYSFGEFDAAHVVETHKNANGTIFKLDDLKIRLFECDNYVSIKQKQLMQELAEREIRNEKIRQQKEKYEEEYKSERAEIEEKDRKAQWNHEEDCRRHKIRQRKQADLPEKHRDQLRKNPVYKRDQTRDL